MIFGCDKHNGKLFGDHTTEERNEDGYFEVKPGVWKEFRDVEENEDGFAVWEDFDSGVVPDLHCEGGQERANELGIQYQPGVGPVINSQLELRQYCDATGHMPHKACRIETYQDVNCMGGKSSRKRTRRVFDGWDRVSGKIRRDKADIQYGASHHNLQQKINAAVHRENEKIRQEPKKFYFTGKLKS